MNKRPRCFVFDHDRSTWCIVMWCQRCLYCCLRHCLGCLFNCNQLIMQISDVDIITTAGSPELPHPAKNLLSMLNQIFCGKVYHDFCWDSANSSSNYKFSDRMKT